MTNIYDLPTNLVEEILSRVPFKHMREVRLTCKDWDTLSKSRSFSKMHIDQLSAVRECESMMMAMIDYNLYLMKVVLVDNEDPIIEWKGKLNNQIKISKVFHCEGLLLCVLKDDATKVIVWNPYLGQTRSIEFRVSRPSYGCDRFSYVLGYEDKRSSRRYKLLRFIDQYVDYKTKDKFWWYEIYDFESSSWKTLDVTPHWRIRFHHGVFLKGNTYWPASRRETEEESFFDDYIICFDFTSESFGPLLPLPFDAGYGDYVTLSCVREEKLAVLLTHSEAGPFEFEIWITTKIEAKKVTWSKFLRVLEPDFDPLITCSGFFIDEEKKVTMGFVSDNSITTFNIVGEDGYLKKMKLPEGLGIDIHCNANACSYVPSLVQIKQPASGSKRKEESDLIEKQLYDQNMSRINELKKRSRVW